MTHSIGVEALIELFKQQRLESAVHVSAAMTVGLGDSLNKLKSAAVQLSDKAPQLENEELKAIILELDRITDQLEMFKWDRRNILSISPKKVNLAAYVVGVFAGLHERAVKGRISLLIDVPEETEVVVDSIRCTQVMMALFENAIQALESIHGRPRWIQVSYHEVGENDWVIAVSDNGGGIPDSHPEKIFDLFYSTRTESHAMSLHVAKELCKEMGSQLKLASTGANGTVFEIQFFKKTHEV
jgi:signal transduction histidine kinase